MNLSIIGTGYVGLVTGAVFASKGHTVVCADNDPEKIATLEGGGIPIVEPGLDELVRAQRAAGRLAFTTDIAQAVRSSQVVFICVGTPPRDGSGGADLSSIEHVARAIAPALTSWKLVVEKSTVPVRTGMQVKETIRREAPGAQFDVASNPEFLAEGTAVANALSPDRIVIGVSSDRARETLEELYRPFGAPIIVTDLESAEMIKHASNSFLALKISYVNAVAQLCERAGANVDQVAQGMGLDPRIGPAFLRAGIGYGGSCLPKDVDAFCDLARELGVDFTLLREAQRINTQQRERFQRKIEQALWVVRGKTIGVLGLSFKPGTDDVRESAAIEIAAWLVRQGASVQAHDPVALDKARPLLAGARLVADPYEAARGAHALILATEWEDYREPRLDLVRLRSLVRWPIFLDGRNALDPARMRALGFEYTSVGR